MTTNEQKMEFMTNLGVQPEEGITKLPHHIQLEHLILLLLKYLLVPMLHLVMVDIILSLIPLLRLCIVKVKKNILLILKEKEL